MSADLQERVAELLTHRQWDVIVEAIECWTDGRQPSDLVALGLVAQGVLILDEARRAALSNPTNRGE